MTHVIDFDKVTTVLLQHGEWYALKLRRRGSRRGQPSVLRA
ncbi:MAG TPA: hypothetical protein VKP13_17550 [Nitrospira sp.]|nr:hypothetical protein [Nitrospira sp.]